MKSTFKAFVFAGGLVTLSSALAGTVIQGQFVLDFDEQQLFNLDTQVENINWFDAESSIDKTPQTMRDTPRADSIPDSFTFSVFDDTIPTPPSGLEERAPQASTFEYTGDPSSGTGKIGLAGFHVISTIAGGISMGDYSLSFNSERIGNEANGSGWVLINHHAFKLTAFDLTNVETTIIDSQNFSLKGDVAIASDLAMMLKTPVGTDVGDFRFTTVEQNASTNSNQASYSFETLNLILPSVKINDVDYALTFELIAPADEIGYFELRTAALTESESTVSSIFDAETGLLTMPAIALLDTDTTNTLGSRVTAKMQLIEGSLPTRFSLVFVESINE